MSKKLEKKSFEISNNQDGNIMNIHHTIQNEAGEFIRIKFTHVIINDSNEMVVCVDHRHNIFVFDLTVKKYWLIKDQFKTKCTVGKFVPCSTNKVVFGTKGGQLLIISLSSGVKTFEINVDDEAILDIQIIPMPVAVYTGTLSTPSSSSSSCKTREKEGDKIQVSPSSPPLSPSDEAELRFKSLYLLKTQYKTKLYTYESDVENDKFELINHKTFGLKIVDANFIPNTTNIYSISRDNNIYIFNFKNSEKDKLIKTFPLLSNLNKFHASIINFGDDDINSRAKNSYYHNNSDGGGGGGECYPQYIIKSEFICTNTNNLLYLLTNANLLIIYDVIKLNIVKIIKLLNINIKNINLLINKQQNNNNIFALVQTADCNLYIVNLSYVNIKIKLNYSGNAYKIYQNIANTKLFGVVLSDGEIVIENMAYYVRRIEKYHNNVKELAKTDDLCGKEELLKNVYHELKSSLTLPELFNILKEFGEFPAKYRSLIWRTILKLPQNYEIFHDLMRKGEHKCVENYSKLYPLRDITALRNLKKIISCLSYWCILFSNVDYLPEFVFPFLKIFQNDVLACMEMLMTVLINQCSMWFEYYPIEPLNYLGMIETILTHFDPALIQFYIQHHITPTEYAYAMMKNGMSVVLCDTDWMALWDHLLLEKPYFLIFAIVAYNLVQKHQIVNLKTAKEIENYFFDQNFCNRKQFIRKMYEINDKCPNNLHPRNIIRHEMVFMEAGFYKKFVNYPKMLMEKNIKSLDKLKVENVRLEQKMLQMEKQEKVLSDRLNRNLVKEEHEKRLQEVQKAYEDALLHEEERIAHQRKLLLLYRKQMRERELQILDETRNSVLRKSLTSKESELDNLLKTLERNKIREETDIMIAEENYKDLEANKLENKLLRQNKFYADGTPYGLRFRDTVRSVEMQRQKMFEEMEQIKNDAIREIRK